MNFFYGSNAQGIRTSILDKRWNGLKVWRNALRESNDYMNTETKNEMKICGQCIPFNSTNNLTDEFLWLLVQIQF
jgi:hypothetical protein